MSKALEGAVVQVDVGRDHVPRERFPRDREAVVLRGDGDRPRREVLHRVIRSPVPELQLESGAAEGEAEKLVPEADAEDRTLRQEPLDRRNRTGQGGGIPRAVREEHAVGVVSEYGRRRRRRRKHLHAATGRVQEPHDVALHAEVDRGDAEAVLPPVRAELPGFRGRDGESEIASDHRRRLTNPREKLLRIGDLGRKAGAHRPLRADATDEGPRVEAVKADYALAAEIVGQALLAARAAPPLR